MHCKSFEKSCGETVERGKKNVKRSAAQEEAEEEGDVRITGM